MAPNTGEEARLSPDDAFDVLGNETRMDILQTLGEADRSLAFSELFDRIDYDTTANFSYHLEKLEGHFLRQTSDGYVLRQAGKRVIKAVLSGAVTEAPTLDPQPLDQLSCPYCGSATQIGYHDERVWFACTGCEGVYGVSHAPGDPVVPEDFGFLGYVRLPPAGLQGRTLPEATDAAAIWGHLDFLALASGICPRCAAPVEQSLHVCDEHGSGTDLCPQCDCRHAVQVHARCTNCIHEELTPFVLGRLITTTDFLAFLASHGLNPILPSPDSLFYDVLFDYDEEIVSVDPFEARFTVTIDEDTLTFTVDDELTVVDVSSRSETEHR